MAVTLVKSFVSPRPDFLRFPAPVTFVGSPPASDFTVELRRDGDVNTSAPYPGAAPVTPLTWWAVWPSPECFHH